MSRRRRAPADPGHEREYAEMLRQIRFSEFAATCARSARLQVIAGELRTTARHLVHMSRELRRVRPAGGHEL